MTGMNNQSEKSAHVASQLQNLRRRAEDVKDFVDGVTLRGVQAIVVCER